MILLEFLYFFVLGNFISGTVYDIEILMYPSCNISQTEFDKQKAFVKTLTASITASPNVPESGVITYMRDMDRDYRTKISDHTDISSFNKVVNNFPLMNYMYRTNWALRYAWRKFLNRVNGTRQTQLVFVILVTDGFDRGNHDSKIPEDVAAQMRQDGIDIVTVGFGQKVNLTLMKSIAGKTANIFTFAEFNLDIFSSLAEIAVSGNHIFDLFRVNFPFLYPLNMSENQI